MRVATHPGWYSEPPYERHYSAGELVVERN